MGQILADEREHRRGLVLGFTLAEILLLLLFLLLLALGTKLQQLDKRHKETRNEISVKDSHIRILETAAINAGVDKESLQKLTSAVPIPQKTTLDNEARVRQLESELTAIAADVKSRQKLVVLLNEARKVRPDDPIEMLHRAAKIAEHVGLDVVISDLPKHDTKHTSSLAEGAHDWPPIISLKEADGYYFQSGSAELTNKFRSLLSGVVVDKLLETIKQYKVDVIEVIGHTDEQPLVVRTSNLDWTLIPYLQGQARDPFLPADNAGLGLARAVSVVRVLSEDPRLKTLSILPLSGAQLIDLDDTISSGSSTVTTEQRRRIEIRVRRSHHLGRIDSPPALSLPDSEIVNLANQVRFLGNATVVDADTITIGLDRIRLWGVDALEGNQLCQRQGSAWDCGKDSTAAMRSYIAGKSVSCKPRGRDRYRRWVATCQVNGDDLGGWLVSNGWALDYPEFSNGYYSKHQSSAKSRSLGIWDGEFIAPWEWRKSQTR